MTHPRCTFCGRRDPSHVVWRCRPFRLRDAHGVFDAPDVWLACPVCTTHVEAHNLDALTDRLSTSLAAARQARTGQAPDLRVIEPEARRVVAAFIAMRDEHPTEQEPQA